MKKKKEQLYFTYASEIGDPVHKLILFPVGEFSYPEADEEVALVRVVVVKPKKGEK